MSEKEEIKSSGKETIKSGEWELWLPSGLTSKKRPLGVVAIYKVSGLFKIFKNSFLDLEGGPGFLDLEGELSKAHLWKFITFYSPRTKKAGDLQFKKQRLGFRLHSKKVEGALDLVTCSDGNFTISLKHVLLDFDCKNFFNRTCYFKVKYDEANELHYIELGKPDYEYKKGKGFFPFEESGKK